MSSLFKCCTSVSFGFGKKNATVYDGTNYNSNNNSNDEIISRFSLSQREIYWMTKIEELI